MRIALYVCVALAALGLTSPVEADVAPPTPEQILIMNKRNALESRARRAFGDIGLIEKLRDWRKHWGFILVGEDGSSKAPKLLIKDEYGWYQLRSGETRRLSMNLSVELNRILHQPALWDEDAYNFKSKCKGVPKLFVIMHGGKDKFGRLGCGPQGLAAWAARTADVGHKLSGKVQSTAIPQKRNAPPLGVSPAYYEASGQISGHLFEMAAAWERKTLGGFVEAYAPDIIIEGPFGRYDGRKMAVDWARSLQDWSAPYSEGDRRLRMERLVSKNQEAKDWFYTMHELRWEEAGKPVRQTFSTTWRNHDGLWLIAYQKMSDVKPVTGERIPW